MCGCGVWGVCVCHVVPPSLLCVWVVGGVTDPSLGPCGRGPGARACVCRSERAEAAHGPERRVCARFEASQCLYIPCAELERMRAQNGEISG